MSKAYLNGITVHYQRWSGSEPELVLVHGLATNLAFWYLKLAPLLAHNFGLTMYDLRGHGLSDMPSSGYTTADMVDDLHELIKFLDVRRAHLVGHSYGGTVALHYATLYPDRIASLTLADSRVRVFQPTQRLADWPNSAVWVKALKELGIPIALDDPEMGHQFLEAMAEAKVSGKETSNRLVGRFSPFGFSKNSRRVAEQWLQLVRTTTARNDFTAPAGLTLEKIRCVALPVLLIFGEFSNCLPSCWGLQKYLPHAKTVIVPSVGHFHPVARPAFFERTLHQFLREVTT
jgi:pimeloyl-ACP methyl ester carboxylesterase